jgi:hypothetical protein
MKHFCAVIGLLMAITSPVAAQQICPTRADLSDGLQLLYPNGDGRIFVQHDDGLYQGYFNATNAVPDRYLGPHPHPLLPGMRASAVGDLTIAYADDPQTIDQLAADETWISKVTYFLAGTLFATGTAEVYFGGTYLLSPVTLGACSYETLTYRVTLDVEGENIARMQGSAFQSDDVQYAPKLGLVISSTVLDEDGAPHGDSYFVDVMRASK